MTQWQIIVAGLVTLGLWSYLWKDNFLYRTVEHAFVGLYTAYAVALVYHSHIKPAVVNDIVRDGKFVTLIPLLLGIAIYLRYVPQLNWVSRYPLSFWLGYGAGFVLSYQVQPLLRQLNSTFLVVNNINSLLVVLGVLATLMYFFFTWKAEDPVTTYGGKIGRWFIIVALGAAFGNTVIFRVGLFMGRMQFMLFDFLKLGN